MCLLKHSEMRFLPAPYLQKAEVVSFVNYLFERKTQKALGEEGCWTYLQDTGGYIVQVAKDSEATSLSLVGSPISTHLV